MGHPVSNLRHYRQHGYIAVKDHRVVAEANKGGVEIGYE